VGGDRGCVEILCIARDPRAIQTGTMISKFGHPMGWFFAALVFAFAPLFAAATTDAYASDLESILALSAEFRTTASDVVKARISSSAKATSLRQYTQVIQANEVYIARIISSRNSPSRKAAGFTEYDKSRITDAAIGIRDFAKKLVEDSDLEGSGELKRCAQKLFEALSKLDSEKS